MIHDESEQSIQQRQVNLLVELFVLRLEHHDALAFASLPYVRQVIDSLAPFVHEERRRFTVRRLYPRWEQAAFVSLVPGTRRREGGGWWVTRGWRLYARRRWADDLVDCIVFNRVMIL